MLRIPSLKVSKERHFDSENHVAHVPGASSTLPTLTSTDRDRTMATASLIVSFPCNLRGFHVYKEIWTPEVLCAIHESDNPYDRFAIAARKRLPGSLLIESTVGHLPKEISRITRYM